MSPTWKILIADDDELFCGFLKELLMDDEDYDYEILTAHDDVQARRILRREPVDLAILDMQLRSDDPDDMSGLEIAFRVARRIPTILVTSHRKKDLEQVTALMDRFESERVAVPKTIYKHTVDDDPSMQKLLEAVHRRLVPRVFVVHGHDTAVRDEVRDTVRRLRLRPRVLNVEPGHMILPRFVREARRAHFAVVILTPDDMGASAAKVGPALRSTDRRAAMTTLADELEPRARQNVIFELGYFFALLGLQRVMVLYDERVALPSDTHGVGYVPLDGAGKWRQRLEDALRKASMVRPSSTLR